MRRAFARGPNGAVIVNHERACRAEKNQRHSGRINIFPDVQTGSSHQERSALNPVWLGRCYWTFVSNRCSTTRPSSSSGSSGRPGSPTPAATNSNPALTVVASPLATMNSSRARARCKWFAFLEIRLRVRHRTGRCRAVGADTVRPCTHPGGTRPQRVQHQRVAAVVERQPAAAELVDALHPGKVTGGLFDHRDVVDGVKNPHQ
jgi:hypothetical protein